MPKNRSDGLMLTENDLKRGLTKIFGYDNVKSIEYAIGGTEGLPDTIILNGGGQLAFCELKKVKLPNDNPKFRPRQLEELFNFRCNGNTACVLCLVQETQEILLGIPICEGGRGKSGGRIIVYSCCFIKRFYIEDVREKLFGEKA